MMEALSFRESVPTLEAGEVVDRKTMDEVGIQVVEEARKKSKSRSGSRGKKNKNKEKSSSKTKTGFWSLFAAADSNAYGHGGGYVGGGVYGGRSSSMPPSREGLV
jgi:hypothetical protein